MADILRYLGRIACEGGSTRCQAVAYTTRMGVGGLWYEGRLRRGSTSAKELSVYMPRLVFEPGTYVWWVARVSNAPSQAMFGWRLKLP